MAGIASLAKAKGHTVTGSDQKIYPPMSTVLQELKVKIIEGYDNNVLLKTADLVIIGNALSRGNAAVEYVLSNEIPYMSGPDWLKTHILRNRFVIAVAGTHGKTTVSSIITWLLESAGLSPGFLIGGVPENFGVSARLGQSDYFVIEADEYDTAFFDKRSKFLHYQPNILVINNLEYDHADIFDSIQDIIKQFHHLVRTMAVESVILVPSDSPEVEEVIKLGCWSKVKTFGLKTNDNWIVNFDGLSNKKIKLVDENKSEYVVSTPLMGLHNAWNVTAAISTFSQIKKNIQPAINELPRFANATRRLQLIGTPHGISVYDDFAHHPSAISSSIAAVKRHVQPENLIAVLELRSNTMIMGIHKDNLAKALKEADVVLILKPDNLNWNLDAATNALTRVTISESSENIVDKISSIAKTGDSVLVMSNGASENIPNRVIEKISKLGES